MHAGKETLKTALWKLTVIPHVCTHVCTHMHARAHTHKTENIFKHKSKIVSTYTFSISGSLFWRFLLFLQTTWIEWPE